jgi:hypothetical protein
MANQAELARLNTLANHQKALVAALFRLKRRGAQGIQHPIRALGS